MNNKALLWFVLFSLALAACTHAADKQFSAKLNSNESQTESNAIDLAHVETNYLQQLANCSDPTNKGRAYFALVNMYQNMDRDARLSHAEITGEYCEQALKYPQNALNACRILSIWGDVLELKYRLNPEQFTGDQFSQVRCLAVKPYLKGLAIIMTNQIPEVSQTTPRLYSLTIQGPGTNEYALKRKKEHDELVKAYYRVTFENAMMEYREEFTARITRLYRNHPTSLYELREVAYQELQNTNFVDAFIQKMQTRISNK